MLLDRIKDYSLILATQSPRRHYLMKEAGFDFKIIIPNNIEEIYPSSLSKHQVPLYLAELKASWFEGKLKNNEIVITADTIVAIDGLVLGKPSGYNEAFLMLQRLSGRAHDVVTAVCLYNNQIKRTFSSVSKVYFRNLSAQEIDYYIATFQPYDKAGAYGAQEWIGFVGIEKIEGSYFNVMGFPIHQFYQELEKFIEQLND